MAAILVLTGTSGCGKTTLARALNALELPGVACFHCDTIYNDLPDELRADGEAVQDAILEHWVKHALRSPDITLAVLETQIRPHRAHALLERLQIAVFQVVLVECEQAERETRLRELRRQPELVIVQMEHWACYLRGQADALVLPILNTSRAPVSESLQLLQPIVESLLERARTLVS